MAYSTDLLREINQAIKRLEELVSLVTVLRNSELVKVYQ
jgi:hypothetical protein